MAGPRVAVTGAGGFIGRATVAALVAAGAEVSGLVGPVVDGRLPEPAETGRWLWGSIEDADLLEHVVDGCSTVIHLAGPPSVGRSFAAPAQAIAAHAAGTANVVDAARRAGSVGRVVLGSSAEVYGLPQTSTVDERHPLRPLSPYAVAKLAGEGLTEVLARCHDLEAIAVRPFAVYGPGSPPWSLVGGTVDQAVSAGEAPVTLHDLSRVRDLTYVNDVAELFVRAATVRVPGLAGRLMAVNACTGVGTSVRELAQAVLLAAGREAAVAERPRVAQPRDGALHGIRPEWSDPARLVGSPSRAKELLGWTPVTPLDVGLRAVVAERAFVAT